MTVSMDELLSRLEGVEQIKPDRWKALCPAHADHEPSLSITKADDRILVNCLAGCQFPDVLKALNLEAKDLFFNENGSTPKPRGRKIVATYDYTGEGGELLFQVVRYEPKDFKQRRPDGNGGWIWNVKGVTLSLYHEAEVLQGIKAGRTLFIVEGEKDADNLRALGLVATTNPMGADKWRDAYSDTLKGAHVAILPDRDEPGRRHAQQVAQSLQGKAASVKVMELPGQGKDASDWVAAGGTCEALQELAASAPVWQPVGAKKAKSGWTCEALLKAEFPPPVWVVPDLLSVGLAILAGRPKLGKSRLALQLAVAVGTGGMWLDRKVEKGTVLAILMEDSPRRIQRRLRQVKSPGDAAIRFEFGLAASLNTGEGLDAFWALVDETNPKLVILDTLARCFGGKIDWNAVGDTVGALSSLQAEAMQRDICILFIDHHRKGTGENRDTISDVVSSVAKPGIADTIMGFYRSPGKKEWTLTVTGRDVEETELALSYDGLTACWQSLGDAESVRKDSVQAEVVAALTDLGGKATTAEIAEHTGMDRGNVSRTLGDLIAAGFVRRVTKKEGRNVPYELLS